MPKKKPKLIIKKSSEKVNFPQFVKEVLKFNEKKKDKK